jgi:hypothetical protein
VVLKSRSLCTNRLTRLTCHLVYLDAGAFEAVLSPVVFLLSKWSLYDCLIQDAANHRRRM